MDRRGFENGSETKISDNPSLFEPKGLAMDFQEQALQHTQIRETLGAAISEGKPIDPAAYRSDRQCPTGCWLHGEAARRWAGNHAFLGLLEAHRAFHARAGEVAELARRGQSSEAQRALRNGTPFAESLADLNAAFRRMRAAATVAA